MEERQNKSEKKNRKKLKMVSYFFMPCLIFRMPLRKTILLCGGDGIELDWLDLVVIDTVDVDADVSNTKQFFGFAAAPNDNTMKIVIN